jgi:hypothetical protein
MSQTFHFWETIASSISLHFIHLFRWFLSSWFSFGWQCPHKKIFQGLLHKEDESKQNHERTGSIKSQEKKRKAIR